MSYLGKKYCKGKPTTIKRKNLEKARAALRELKNCSANEEVQRVRGLPCPLPSTSRDSFVVSKVVELVPATTSSDELMSEPKKETVMDIETDVNDDIIDLEYSGQMENNGNEIRIEGNRIINFEYFFCELMKIAQHNDRFGCNLSSLKIIKENQYGLLSTFHLECRMCKSKFKLNNLDQRDDTLTLNEGAVSGAIITGIGLSNLNEINASMDLPLMSFRTYRKCHDKVAELWRNAAEESMIAAANEEGNAALIRGDVTEQNIPMVPVEADCCWSKRSYKTNYSALSGVAAIIGHNFGKVLHVGVKNKYCLICARAKKNGDNLPAHKCNKNHSGPSTSMEPAIIVECFQSSILERGLIYNPLIADGDASTYNKLVVSRPYPGIPIQKIECTNHLLRNYNGKNLALQKDTTVPLWERKLLNPDRLTRLRTAVRAAVRYRRSENCTEAEKIKHLHKDIINSPKHIFGEHSECHSYFCNESRRNEPNHATAAKTLLLRLQKNASQLALHSRSLLKKFTTNRAEQFNSIVAKTVGGKRVNFSLKDSYTVRCYAAVVNFNTGQPLTSLYKSAFQKNPVKSVQKLEKKRTLQNINRKPRNIHFGLATTVPNIDYGNACQKPDMSSNEFLEAKKNFLENLAQQAEKRYEIEKETILQAESALWLELRRCILTASKFAKICKRRPNLNSAPLVKSILYSQSLDHIPAILHGKKSEEVALRQLAIQEKIVIKKCGLFIDKDYCYLGASPDGLFGDDGLIEIKCPLTCYGIDCDSAIEQKMLKCFKKENGIMSFNRNHDWFYQIQGQLHITNKTVCLFGVWTGPELPIKTIKIVRDNQFWAEKMFPKLENFYSVCILPEIVDSRKSRTMPLRDIIL